MNMVNEPLPSAQPGSYKKPPVVEMILAIRVAQPQVLDPTIFLDPVRDRFPQIEKEHKQILAVEGNVKVQVDGPADGQLQSRLAGYRFVALDKSYIAQYMVNGLTLNFLPPYTGYAPSLSVFKEHWSLYQKLCNKPPVAALVLRYIDRIDIPQTGNSLSLSDYFTIAPPTLGLNAHQCYLQYALNDVNEDVRARVIWSSLEDKPKHWSFALDTEATLDPATVESEEQLWLEFDRLHNWCTHVFNESLTPECKQLFK